MIAAAYGYGTSGGDTPKEYRIWKYIERYGIQAVYGRPLTMAELVRIDAVRIIIEGCLSLQAAKNKVEWKKHNQDAWSVIDRAAGIYARIAGSHVEVPDGPDPDDDQDAED